MHGMDQFHAYGFAIGVRRIGLHLDEQITDYRVEGAAS